MYCKPRLSVTVTAEQILKFGFLQMGGATGNYPIDYRVVKNNSSKYPQVISGTKCTRCGFSDAHDDGYPVSLVLHLCDECDQFHYVCEDCIQSCRSCGDASLCADAAKAKNGRCVICWLVTFEDLAEQKAFDKGEI